MRGNASEDSWQKRVRRKWLCELTTSQQAEKQKPNHTGYRAIFNLGVFTPCPQCSGQCNSRMTLSEPWAQDRREGRSEKQRQEGACSGASPPWKLGRVTPFLRALFSSPALSLRLCITVLLLL